MSRLKRNIFANFAGQGWSAVMALAFVPIYIKFLGIEAYGLIGFFAMLQASFQVLDLGLSQTMNREMARYSVLPDKSVEARDLVRTLEVGYWAIGIVIGVLLLAMAPFIAGHWIKSSLIPAQTVQQAVMIMGVVTAIQWPLSFYEGGLMGLQKQVLSNSIKIGMATLNSCGAAFILWKVSPTITAFFTWQVIVAILYVALITFFLWRSLPEAECVPRFNLQAARNIWRFAAGMSGIGVSAIILMQIDKIILSKLLSLEMFGYYILAATICNVIPNMLAGPVFNATFPRLSSLVILNDESAMTLLYHQGTQLMAVLALPISFVISFFSYDILILWTGTTKIALTASPIVSFLVIAMAINAITVLTYALQLAHGWTSIGLRINIFFIVTFVPTIYYMTTHYGAVGAAQAWLLLNCIYVLISLPLTHRRILKGELHRWIFVDVAPPLVSAFIVVGVGRWLVPGHLSDMQSIAALATVFLCALSAAAIAARHTRTWILDKLTRNLPSRASL